MNETELNNEKENSTRPTSLKALCILTFISSGIGCLSAIITPLFSDIMIDFLKSTNDYDETMMTEIIRLFKAGWVYYLTVFLLTFSSLLGAVFMWKLKKAGFHIYALSNSALLFIPTLFFGITVSWFGIFITAGFIALYAFHLKYMS